jgi:hypothetical protein
MRMSVASARSRVAVGLMAGALLVGGCTESVEEASGDFCSDVDTLEAELASLESLVEGDATLDDIEAQREVVREAYDATVSSGGDLDEAVSSEADAAYDSYQEAVDAVPGDATLSEAAPEYASAVQDYLASLAMIATDAGCETAS